MQIEFNGHTTVFFIQNFQKSDFDYDELLKNYLLKYDSEYFDSSEHAINYLEILALNWMLFPDKIPQFIFLDIEFMGQTGFDFLTRFDQINQQFDFAVKVIAIIDNAIPYYREKCLSYKSNFICINRVC